LSTSAIACSAMPPRRISVMRRASALRLSTAARRDPAAPGSSGPFSTTTSPPTRCTRIRSAASASSAEADRSPSADDERAGDATCDPVHGVVEARPVERCRAGAVDHDPGQLPPGPLALAPNGGHRPARSVRWVRPANGHVAQHRVAREDRVGSVDLDRVDPPLNPGRVVDEVARPLLGHGRVVDRDRDRTAAERALRP
jgi:hypothetical protein